MFKIRASVSKRSDIFSQHPGYYCENQRDKIPIPQIPDTFSHVVEIIDEGSKIASTVKVSFLIKITVKIYYLKT